MSNETLKSTVGIFKQFSSSFPSYALALKPSVFHLFYALLCLFYFSRSHFYFIFNNTLSYLNNRFNNIRVLWFFFSMLLICLKIHWLALGMLLTPAQMSWIINKQTNKDTLIPKPPNNISNNIFFLCISPKIFIYFIFCAFHLTFFFFMSRVFVW